MTSTSDMQNETDNTLDLDAKLVEYFPGKLVRKDLTKRLKEALLLVAGRLLLYLRQSGSQIVV